jgi:biopolymer transport protein ExbD
MNSSRRTAHAVPYINVTPLTDVLLVLLIIFMVVTPLKPSRFMTQVPEPLEPPKGPPPLASHLTLVVAIKQDRTLELNNARGMGSVGDSGKLSAALARVFEERLKERTYRDDMVYRSDLPDDTRIQRTVFIKAPKSIPYGEVVKVLDGIKGAGAEPVGLQIDQLD